MTRKQQDSLFFAGLLVAGLIVLPWALGHCQDVPFVQKSMEQDQDMGSIQSNFRDLIDRTKDEVGGSQDVGVKCFGNPALCIDENTQTVNLGGATTFSATTTFDGPATFNDSVTFNGAVNLVDVDSMTITGQFLMNTVTPPASTFVLNTLSNSMMISGMLLYDQTGPTILASVNVTSVTDVTTGVFRVNWGTPMVTTNYFCNGMVSTPSGVQAYIINTCSGDNPVGCTGILVGSASFHVQNHGATQVDAERISIICFGGNP